MAKSSSIDLYKQALQTIRSNPAPVYYLYGEESFFIDKLQEAVISLVPDEQKDFNFDLIYGNESSPVKVLSVARSFPMMAERRVVVVRDFQKLKSQESGDGQLSDFENYVKNPNPSTVLCLIDKKFPDRRTSLGKAMSGKQTDVLNFDFSKLDDNALPGWIIQWTKQKHNKNIDARAAQILAQLVGNDLHLLSTEVEKVCTFVDTQTDVTLDHVKKIIGSYREYSVIELKEAIFRRNLDESLGIAEQMLLKSNADAGEVIRSVGFFYSVFSDVWQILRLKEKGFERNRIQSEMSINPYVFKYKWNEAAQFRYQEMPRIFEALLDADRASKGFTTLDTPSILLLLIKRILG